jgi:WD40 repeat protein
MSPDVLVLRGHDAYLYALTISPDGRRIASASIDGNIKVWDTASGQALLTRRGYNGEFFGLAFSLDGRRIASSEADGIKVWDATSGKGIFALATHANSRASVAFRADGQLVTASGSENGDRILKVWDMTSGQEVSSRRDRNAMAALALSPDGRRALSFSVDTSDPYKVVDTKIVDLASGNEILTLQRDAVGCLRAAFSPNGRLIATADTFDTVSVCDADNGQRVHSLRSETWQTMDVTFSPDSRRLASGGTDGTIKVWDMQSGQRLLTLQGHSENIDGVVFSSDGSRIVSASDDKTIRIWDATPVESQTEGERAALADARWDVWQRYEADDALKQKLWFAAAWHFDQLAKRHPEEPQLGSRLSFVRARLDEENARLLQTVMPDLPADAFAR